MYFKHRFYPFALAATLWMITACSWVDSYSSTACQQLLLLEQLHLQFISDAATVPVDQRRLKQEDRQIRQQFSLALSDSDPLRQNNLRELEKNYQRLYVRVFRQDAALTPFAAAVLRSRRKIFISRPSAAKNGVQGESNVQRRKNERPVHRLRDEYGRVAAADGRNR